MDYKLPVGAFEQQPRTPFYYYDLKLLDDTLSSIREHSAYPGYKVHYAVKANANPIILKRIADAGFGADVVSGGELSAAVNAGFTNDTIVYAGVGKADWEIELALNKNIACLNVESMAELEVIEEICHRMGKSVCVALRVNPNVDAHTHHYITTGLSENKFGIDIEKLDEIITRCQNSDCIKLKGLHFHIGSQITETTPFENLCKRINEIQDKYNEKGIYFETINVGGGLGVNYDDPEAEPIPDFKSYFETFNKHLNLREGQELHFELGRSVVCQCGSLITKVLYVKNGVVKNFVIVDAGFSDLIRPALYQAHHKIENLTGHGGSEKYDVVGPICESSDCFGEQETLPVTHRGDLIAIRSAGAYGEIMASQYNCRQLPAVLAK